MSNIQKRLLAVTLSALAALGAASIAANGSQTETETDLVAGNRVGPLACELEATPSGRGIALSGIVHADTPLDGSYRFKVMTTGRSGRSNISQGGNFSAGPNNSARLGKVMITNRDAVHDIELEVTSHGIRVTCDERIDGAI